MEENKNTSSSPVVAEDVISDAAVEGTVTVNEMENDDPFDAEVADATVATVSSPYKMQNVPSAGNSVNLNNVSTFNLYSSERTRRDDCNVPSSSVPVDDMARSSSVCSSMEDFVERPSSSIATQEDAHGSAQEDLEMDMVDSAEDTGTIGNSSGEISNTKDEQEVTGASNDAVNNKCNKSTLSKEKNITTVGSSAPATGGDNDGKECVTNRGKNTSSTATCSMSSASNRQSSYKRKKQSWRRGKYTRSTGNPKGKGRRTIFKKIVYKSPSSFASPIALDSLNHSGILYRKGDIVSLVNEDDSDTTVYFAQIRGFLVDQYAQKSASITWLLPTGDTVDDGTFDPASYILGPEEDSPRSLDTMEFVCHAPSDYYRLKSPYPLQPDPVTVGNAGYTWTRLGVVVLAHKGETIDQVERVD